MTLRGAGTRTDGVIRCDRPRALDMVARHGPHIDTVPEHVVGDAMARLATRLELTVQQAWVADPALGNASHGLRFGDISARPRLPG